MPASNNIPQILWPDANQVDRWKAFELFPAFTNLSSKKGWTANVAGTPNTSEYSRAEMEARGLKGDVEWFYQGGIEIMFNSLGFGISGSVTLDNMSTAQLDQCANYFAGVQYKYIITDYEPNNNTNLWASYPTQNKWKLQYIANKVYQQSGKYLMDIFDVYEFNINGTQVGDNKLLTSDYNASTLLTALANPSSHFTYNGTANSLELEDIGYNEFIYDTSDYTTGNAHPSNKFFCMIDSYLGRLQYPMTFNRANPNSKMFLMCCFYVDRNYVKVANSRYRLIDSLKGTVNHTYNGMMTQTRILPEWPAQQMFDYLFYSLCNPSVRHIHNWMNINSFNSLNPRSTRVLHNGVDIHNADVVLGNYEGSDYGPGLKGGEETENEQLEQLIRAFYRFYGAAINGFTPSQICDDTQVHECPSFQYRLKPTDSFITVSNPNDHSEVVRSLVNHQPFLTVWFNASLNKRIVLFQSPFSVIENDCEFSFSVGGQTYTRTTEGSDLFVDII